MQAGQVGAATQHRVHEAGASNGRGHAGIWAAALWLANSNPDDRELRVPPSTQRTLCFSLSARQLPKFNSLHIQIAG